MLSRSLDNGNAALNLLMHKHYNNSVVSFYYCVLQRMMFALNNTTSTPIPYDLQNPLNEDIHFRILHEVMNRISNDRERSNLETLFSELFKYRKIADYTSNNITEEECLRCRELKEGLISRLNRFFPIR